MAVDLGYDESGGGDTLIVSVQAGITEQVRGMSRQWKSALGPVRYFHSKDFRNYTSGIFTESGMDRRGRHDLLKDLSKLVRRHLLFSVSASVSQREYDSLTTPQFRSRFGTAYAFLIDMCMLFSHSQIGHRSGGTSEFNILIESGHRNSEQIAQILSKIKDVPVELLPMPIKILTAGLGSKEDHPVLQAADMAAYSQWQSICDADPTIWDALYKPGNNFRGWEMECDKQVIETFVAGPQIAAETFIAQPNVQEVSNGRISKIQQAGAGSSQGAPLGDQNQTGGGKDNQKAEEG